MALSQPATFNEPWSDERVAAFMTIQPPHGVSADFHILYNAYKHMRPHDFERLLVLFRAEGRDVNAKNEHGQTLADILSALPRHSTSFLALLQKN